MPKEVSQTEGKWYKREIWNIRNEGRVTEMVEAG